MEKQKFTALVIGNRKEFKAADSIKTIDTDEYIITLIFSHHVEVLDIDFVVVDTDMTPQDCLIFQRNVRELSTKIPIFLVSTQISRERRQSYKRLGVIDAFKKPLTIEKLNNIANVLCERRSKGDMNYISNFDSSLSGLEICKALTDNLIEIGYKTRYLSRAFTTDSYRKKLSLAKIFQKVVLFKDLTPYGMMLVLESVQKYRFEAGTVILAEGKGVDHVYIVHQGILEILIDGEEVDQRGEREIVGELSCLTGVKVATASVRAKTNCTLWGIESQLFKKLLNYIPELRRNAFEVLVNKLSSLSFRFKEVLQHIPYGLLKIEPDGRISEEYSSRCSEYLERFPLKGENIVDILVDKETLLYESFKKNFKLLQSAPEDVSEIIRKFPEEVTYSAKGGALKVFKLHYQISANSSKDHFFIDMGFEDITTQRAYESELFTVKNLLSKQELLFIIIDINTGQITQESFSNSTLGRTHFPQWNNLNGKNIFQTILKDEDEKKVEHLDRWLSMINDPFYQSSMGIEEIAELAPTFVFESHAGQVVELSFELDTKAQSHFDETFCRFKFIEEKQSNDAAIGLTKTLLEEVTQSEKEHKQSLHENLSEMATGIEDIYALLETRSPQKEIFRTAHSLKGLAQSFGLNTITNQAHKVEDILKETDIRDITKEHEIYGFLEELAASVVISRSVCFSESHVDTGKIRCRVPEITITLIQFEELKEMTMKVLREDALNDLKGVDVDEVRKLKSKILSLEMTPLDIVFPRIQRILEDNHRALNKKVRLVINSDFSISTRCSIGYKISSSMIQVVKNALFHGIESVYKRREAGKDEIGKIQIDISNENDRLKIVIFDDGKGLNYETILNRGIEQKLINESQARQWLKERNFQNIHNLVFREGFSTANSVNLLSGRGVGMGMIKSDMEKIGGGVDVLSEEGKGTTVQLSIPIQENDLICVKKLTSENTCFD